MKKFIVAFVAVAVVLAAFVLWNPRGSSVPSGITASTSLYGRILTAPAGWGFGSGNISQPGPTLVSYVTTALTLTIHSADGAPHTWFLDYNGDGIQQANEPGSGSTTSSLTFSLTLWQPGTFHYACAIHGNGMSGVITIKPLDLAAFPTPFTYSNAMNTSVVIGNSIAHNGLSAASTIDVVGLGVLGTRLGRVAPQGTLLSRLDGEAATGTAAPYTITQAGNIITIGGRGGNMVTATVNPSFAVRQALTTDVCTNSATPRGIFDSETKLCYFNTATENYAMVSIYFDQTNNRYILAIVGLSGFATRIATTLVGLGSLPLSGTGVVVKLVDTNGDGTFDTFQVVDGSGGATTMANPVAIPPY